MKRIKEEEGKHTDISVKGESLNLLRSFINPNKQESPIFRIYEAVNGKKKLFSKTEQQTAEVTRVLARQSSFTDLLKSLNARGVKLESFVTPEVILREVSSRDITVYLEYFQELEEQNAYTEISNIEPAEVFRAVMAVIEDFKKIPIQELTNIGFSTKRKESYARDSYVLLKSVESINSELEIIPFFSEQIEEILGVFNLDTFKCNLVFSQGDFSLKNVAIKLSQDQDNAQKRKIEKLIVGDLDNAAIAGEGDDLARFLNRLRRLSSSHYEYFISELKKDPNLLREVQIFMIYRHLYLLKYYFDRCEYDSDEKLQVRNKRRIQEIWSEVTELFAELSGNSFRD